jgi:hypothetical protein
MNYTPFTFIHLQIGDMVMHFPYDREIAGFRTDTIGSTDVFIVDYTNGETEVYRRDHPFFVQTVHVRRYENSKADYRSIINTKHRTGMKKLYNDE